MQELLNAERLALGGGARRKITVFFADVRGFTEFTDSSQELAIEHVRKNNLDEEQSRGFFDRVAAEQLATVNLYLATIADTIKEHRGTLDKYMGDCVMAFWERRRRTSSMLSVACAPQLRPSGPGTIN